MRDLRHAIRFLWAHKPFTAAAVLTLAIGLGANTAFYGLLNAAVRPLALPHPEQLVTIAADTRGDETGGFQYSFSVEAMKDLQDRADPFSAVVGDMPRVGGFTTGGRTVQFWFSAVSDNYFTGLGVTPALGDLFTAPSGSPVHVVIGHTFWMKTFGGDPRVLGTVVRIEGAPAVVTGVVSPSFHSTLMGVELDGYVALDDYGAITPDARRWLYHNRSARPLELHARLKPDVSVREAQAAKYVLVFEGPQPYVYLPIVRDMSLRTLHVRAAGAPALLAPRLEREIRDLSPDMPIADLRTMNQSLAGIFGFLIFRIGAIQAAGMGVLGLTLAIIGVYGVVSFGASLRTREIGIRVALGAQPGDVLRLILGQGLQLIAVGLLVGLGASIVMSRVISRFLPLVDASDWGTFAGVSAGLAALAIWACYVPARRATRVPVMTALRHE